MPDLFTLESLNGHFSFCVDFYSGRALVRANTLLLPAGIALEPIVDTKDGLGPGMVLMSIEWDVIYFVNIRAEWRLDDYFAHAEALLKKRKRKRV